MIANEYLGKYVIIRTNSAGVFAGILKEVENNSVKLSDARRIWYWDGAASLSELAVKGTSKPENCKFPISLETIVLFNVIEIIKTTDKARESIENVKEWKA